jgi:hypothetical protein
LGFDRLFSFWLEAQKSEGQERRANAQRTLFPEERPAPKTIVKEPKQRAPAGWRKVVTRMPEGNVSLGSLSSVYDGQVFMATHSPVLLQLAEPKEVLCLALTAGGRTPP